MDCPQLTFYCIILRDIQNKGQLEVLSYRWELNVLLDTLFISKQFIHELLPLHI